MKGARFLTVLCMTVGSVCGAETVNMMTYNIHHCAGADRRVDVDRVAAVITNANPSFVGLQEVDCKVSRRSRGIDEPAELARLTGLHATFAATIPLQGGQYGIAVLSREKPISVFKTPLPGREPRMLLLCEFTNCWFGTMHLALQETNRVKSVEIVCRAVQERAGTKPVFLTGDWNSSPKSKTIANIRNSMTILSATDVNTYNSFKPSRRGQRHCIDYIAVDSASSSRVKPLKSWVEEDFVTSDHFPVIVMVSW